MTLVYLTFSIEFPLTYVLSSLCYSVLTYDFRSLHTIGQSRAFFYLETTSLLSAVLIIES